VPGDRFKSAEQLLGGRFCVRVGGQKLKTLPLFCTVPCRQNEVSPLLDEQHPQPVMENIGVLRRSLAAVPPFGTPIESEVTFDLERLT
jgi:hypothetical protein